MGMRRNLGDKTVVSAPGKLMLFGEHAVVYGYPCLVTAVDQRVKVLAKKNNGAKIVIKAPDVGLLDYSLAINELKAKTKLPKGARFVVGAVENFFTEFDINSGLEIETRSEFSSEFGFGSSSAVTVAVIKALSELFAIKIDKKGLFNLSYKTVLDVQGVGSGFDLAAAIWGGTLWFVGGGKTLSPLLAEELPIVVGYTGIKADTATLVRQVAEKKRSYPKAVAETFETISLITREAKIALEAKNWSKLGELMNFNQGLLEALGVNTKELSALVYAARKAGAFGAKLSGAGGGDCMIALVNSETRDLVEKNIEKAGGEVLKVELNAEGVKNESNR